MALMNSYFQKREEHMVTFKSGSRSMVVENFLCRQCGLKEIGDCKVVT